MQTSIIVVGKDLSEPESEVLQNIDMIFERSMSLEGIMLNALVEDCCDVVMKEGVKMSDSGIVFPIDELVDKAPTSLRGREKIMSYTCILERF